MSLTVILFSKASDLTAHAEISISTHWRQADGLYGPGWMCTLVRVGADLQQGWGKREAGEVRGEDLYLARWSPSLPSKC